MSGTTNETAVIEPRVIRIENEVFIEAPVERVWEALTTGMGAWWPHRHKEDALGAVLEPKVGGRFYEDWGDGNGALFGHVVYIDPPHKLSTRGPMGMKLAASTVMWYVLEAKDGGMVLKFSLHAFGDIPDETVEGYTKGTQELLHEALKPYVEGKKD
jgi:uncharacterized protein YndB with AHSA1/START domain